jgi:tRNA 2-thiouridine synthesizing protein A
VSSGDPGAPAPAERPGLVIDALGRKCPVPVILLAERIAEVAEGQLVELLADDPVARTDVPAWCALQPHELVRQQKGRQGWSFVIRRAPGGGTGLPA